MLLDQQNVFFDGNLANGANTSDIIDMIGALNLGTPNYLTGGAFEIFYKSGTKGNADNTVAFTLEGADDAAMSSNKITVASQAATNVAAGATLHIPIPNHAAKRFYRLTITVAGTTAAITGAKCFLHSTNNQRSAAGLGLV